MRDAKRKCYVIQNRGGAFWAVDSLGPLWTAHLPMAYPFDHPSEAQEARLGSAGETVLDVTGWATRPMFHDERKESA